MQRLLYLFILLFITNISSAQENNPIVKIEHGKYNEAGKFIESSRTLNEYDQSHNLLDNKIYNWDQDEMKLVLNRHYYLEYVLDNNGRILELRSFSGVLDTVPLEIFYTYHEDGYKESGTRIAYKDDGTPLLKEIWTYNKSASRSFQTEIKYHWHQRPNELGYWQFHEQEVYERDGLNRTKTYYNRDSIATSQSVYRYNEEERTGYDINIYIPNNDTTLQSRDIYDEVGDIIETEYYTDYFYDEEDRVYVEPYVHERILSDYDEQGNATRIERYERHADYVDLKLIERQLFSYNYDDEDRLTRWYLEAHTVFCYQGDCSSELPNHGATYQYYCDGLLSEKTYLSEVRTGSTTRYYYLYGIDCEVLNIDEIDLYIFPNPFSESLTIESDILLHPNNALELYDASGKLVYFDKVGERLQNYELYLPQLAKGMYFLRIYSGEQAVVQKVIKN